MPPFSREGPYGADWRLFQKSAAILYRTTEALSADIETLEASEYRVVSFDCAAWSTDADMHFAIRQRFQFLEDLQSKSLDALNDHFCEQLIIPPHTGVILAFANFDQYYERSPKTAWQLIDILAGVQRWYMLFGDRFLTLVHANDPSFQMKPIGALLLWPSPREVRIKARAVWEARHPGWIWPSQP